MMASTLAISVSRLLRPLSDNPSRKSLRLRAHAAMIASAYTYDGATTSVRTNVGKARSYGGEASFTIRPVRPMTINFGVALLDTTER